MMKTENRDKYSTKLRDPRWQKIRLQVFERDMWCCQYCFGSEITLHVHHLYYERDKEPWEYPLEALTTLCADCHESETRERPVAENSLLEALRRRGFSAFCVSQLADGFNVMPMVHCEDVVATSIKYSLTSEPLQNILGTLSLLGDLKEEALSEIWEIIRSYYLRHCSERKQLEPLPIQQ